MGIHIVKWVLRLVWYDLLGDTVHCFLMYFLVCPLRPLWRFLISELTNFNPLMYSHNLPALQHPFLVYDYAGLSILDLWKLYHFCVVQQTKEASRKYLFTLFTILVVVQVECGCRSLRTSTHIKQGIKTGMFSGQFVSRDTWSAEWTG